MLGALLAQVDLRESFKLNAQGDTVHDVFGTPAKLINVLMPNVYVFSGLIIFGLLVFGGLSIIMSAGDPKGTEKGTQAIKGALIGFLIIFSAYWIIQIIEIVTGLRILDSGAQ